MYCSVALAIFCGMLGLKETGSSLLDFLANNNSEFFIPHSIPILESYCYRPYFTAYKFLFHPHHYPFSLSNTFIKLYSIEPILPLNSPKFRYELISSLHTSNKRTITQLSEHPQKTNITRIKPTRRTLYYFAIVLSLSTCPLVPAKGFPVIKRMKESWRKLKRKFKPQTNIGFHTKNLYYIKKCRWKTVESKGRSN